jgi:microcystin-dependent protein
MDVFLAEIRIFPFNFAPTGWALCNGQLMPISQNTALFSLLGTTYGGDGKSTFGLPNLQGAAPLMAGQGAGLSFYNLGQSGGEASVTLLTSQMPAHSHAINALNFLGETSNPAGQVWAESVAGRQNTSLYTQNTAQNVNMSAQAIAVTGSSQAHNNMPPFLTLTFCIALTGIFPSRP